MAEDISLDLGCYGMKGVKTPTLDNMAKMGGSLIIATSLTLFVRQVVQL